MIGRCTSLQQLATCNESLWRTRPWWSHKATSKWNAFSAPWSIARAWSYLSCYNVVTTSAARYVIWIQYNTVQYSIQYSSTVYSTIHYNTVLYNTVLYTTVLYNIVCIYIYNYIYIHTYICIYIYPMIFTSKSLIRSQLLNHFVSGGDSKMACVSFGQEW
jgi:hypothetical protein